MTERGHSTAGLPRDASHAQVRQTLAWADAGWPWAHYGPVVMAAVREGVPVVGDNLPRAQMRAAMQDSTLDARLPAPQLAEQEARIRTGHCNALPGSQIRPMTRVLIARGLAMADTVTGARQPGRGVLLVAGNGHVREDLGVPLHLPTSVAHKVVMAQAGNPKDASPPPADAVWETPALPPRDHCAELKQRMPAR